MNFDDCICAHAEYSVFVPKLSYALNSELFCFDAVVFQLGYMYMEMAISKSVIETHREIEC